MNRILNTLTVKLITSFLLIMAITCAAGAAPLPPDQGPGGPILVVTASANPFTKYYAEILRAEGLNAFAVADISSISPLTLAGYDVVILGEISLTASQVTMFSDYVTSGGNLIAMRPDKKLASLLGLTASSSTLSDKYLLIDTSTAPGAGLVNDTIQFHGTADLYTTNGATVLASLYSDDVTATVNPAVTWRSIGTQGGQAAAFTFDLARSVVYTRQGNPAWSGQLRDSTPFPPGTDTSFGPTRAYDLFYGDASLDPQPDWIDLNKVAIPQADEQQRLLANLILLMNIDRKPLPRFWYFPRGEKAVVIMTGDGHSGADPASRFESYKAMSTPGCSVADWECIRATAYIYSTTPLSNAQAAAYTADGFEVALHVNPGCIDWTSAASLDFVYSSQLTDWETTFSSVPPPVTNRTHCVIWSDYSTQPQVEQSHGIRLDTTYYYWPPAWILDRPGLFTGSGMPMRFATSNGTIIDVYQAVSQMTDESDQSYPVTIDSLLDKAIGQEGYYGAFTANMHSDTANGAIGSPLIVASAVARGVPVVSAKQMLTWLDGRNSSSFGAFGWNGSVLSFTIAADVGANGLTAMLPTLVTNKVLTGLTRNGVPISYGTEIVKGIEYAVFSAITGNYQATYVIDTTPPETTITANPPTVDSSTSASFSFIGSQFDNTFGCSLDGAAFTSCSSPKTYNTLSAGNHTFQVRATDPAGNTDPTPASYNWTIDPTFLTFNDTTVADFSAGTLDAGTYISQMTDGEIILAPTIGAEFSGSGLPAGWSSTFLGGSILFGNGATTVDGALLGTSTFYGPGHTVEFEATFGGGPFQNVGFGIDLSSNTQSWAISSTGSGGGLLARTNDGTNRTDTPIALNLLGAPHRYRIDWNSCGVVFSVDGTQVASHPTCISSNLRPVIADGVVDGHSFSVNWLRMSPYAASGTFFSRVFDAGAPLGWGNVFWSSVTPPGTTLVISVRQGNTPVPDGTWTPFSTLAGPGAAVPSVSRYLQYRAQLATNDSRETPALNNISFSSGIILDTTPPDTTITSTPPATSNSPNASFGFVSTKNFSSFSCSLDGAVFSPCTSPKSYSGLSNGSHTFQVRATDLGGHSDPTPAAFTWTITSDTTPPNSTITNKPPLITNNTSASFSFTSTEAGSTFACSLDTEPFTPCTSPKNYSGLPQGVHLFRVRATDPAGNIDTTPAFYAWLVWTTPPDTAITSGPAAATTSNTASFSFNALLAGTEFPLPASTFACSLDGGPFASCTSPKTYTSLGAGTHNFKVRATDGVGNIDPSPASYTWVIDVTPPDTTITGKPAAVTNITSGSFSFASTEANSTFACKLDAGSFGSCTSPKTYGSLSAGSHTFQVRATDPAGNTDPTPGTYTWTIDTTAPDTSITAKPSATSNSTSATFSFTSTEASSSFSCSLDGGAFTACSSPKVYTALSVASHTFKVQATDAAGNTDATPASSSWTVTAITACPASTTILSGSLRTSNQLCSDNNTYYEVNSTTSGTRTSSWYGAFTGVANSLSTLKVTYSGKNSTSASQTISIWNWTTSAWVTLDQRTVGTTETLIANLVPPGTLSDYVSGTSGTGELRVRVNSTAATNFYSSGDAMQITYTTQ